MSTSPASPSSSHDTLAFEFTVEPFVPANPGPHVLAAQDAAQSIAEHGGIVDIGPFGTTATGASSEVLVAVTAALEAAFANGADRVSLQISRVRG
ncbi:MAG: thiamine-binding protein [Acidimicrobiales bacterium]